MTLTERQEKILQQIIREYIDLAHPVSSHLLERRGSFGISPATIRIEMQKLTDKGYLSQPHTSAGRIPTDKGYRFFVDDLLEKKFWDFNEKLFNEIYQIEKEFKDSLKFIQVLTKKLAELTSNLVINYLSKEEVVLKEGWEEVLKEPEFEEKDYLINFTKFLENFEKNIENFEINSDIKIYIGRETPFKKAKDFSIISSKFYLPESEETIISLLGPKRMDYDRNIGLIKSLTKLLEEI